jgi:peptidoglycan/LPS O-acetylase OafA/YrhL
MSSPLLPEPQPVFERVENSNEIIGIDNRLIQDKQKRIPELDGLRGIAVLMVVAFHYVNNQLINSNTYLGRIFYKLTSVGWVGVDLFFVLSGFLIGTILMNNRDSKNYFFTFYIRRIVRIIPNYYLLIALFAIICSIPFFSSDYFLTGNNVIPIWAYLVMLHNIFIAHLQNFGNTSVSVTWSIGVEEQFYIVFPLMVYFLKEKWLPWLLVLAIIIAPIVRMQYNNWVPAYVLLPCRMDSIAFGALIAYTNHFHSLSAFVKRYRTVIVFTFVLDVAICIFLSARYGDLGIFRNTLFAIVFSTMVVFALVYKNSIYGSILRLKKLVWIGTISYSLYLFHDMIIGLCRHFLGNLGENALETGRGGLVTIVALILSTGFSWLVYKRLETPFVNFGKKFKYQE